MWSPLSPESTRSLALRIMRTTSATLVRLLSLHLPVWSEHPLSCCCVVVLLLNWLLPQNIIHRIYIFLNTFLFSSTATNHLPPSNPSSVILKLIHKSFLCFFKWTFLNWVKTWKVVAGVFSFDTVLFPLFFLFLKIYKQKYKTPK